MNPPQPFVVVARTLVEHAPVARASRVPVVLAGIALVARALAPPVAHAIPSRGEHVHVRRWLVRLLLGRELRALDELGLLPELLRGGGRSCWVQ